MPPQVLHRLIVATAIAASLAGVGCATVVASGGDALASRAICAAPAATAPAPIGPDAALAASVATRAPAVDDHRVEAREPRAIARPRGRGRLFLRDRRLLL